MQIILEMELIKYYICSYLLLCVIKSRSYGIYISFCASHYIFYREPVKLCSRSMFSIFQQFKAQNALILYLFPFFSSLFLYDTAPGKREQFWKVERSITRSKCKSVSEFFITFFLLDAMLFKTLQSV